MTLPLWVIPALPLLGFLVCGLAGKKMGQSFVSAVGAGSVLLATVAAFTRLIPFAAGSREPVVEKLASWIAAGHFSVDLSFRLDPLSVLMTSFVTFVGFLIHVYSIGYMRHDETDAGYARYFAYLNLFMFSMLTLVLAQNFLLLFVGWEGVGLCSYLLVGYYYDREYAAAAGKKAFVVNRIGDFGFLLGMFGIFSLFGSLDFDEVFGLAAAHPDRYAPLLTIVCLCLFVGAMGKSAQVPLYVWLPDAMAGPTPVSALIHAATMVTAGVYMVARCNVLFRLAPDAMGVVAVIGGVTAIFAALIGLAQNDIKKVLAYSTVSQLGYMFLACGVGAFVAGMFHVMTHAFFKACLFLGSGSVIHAMGGEQDMRKMGGLKSKLPTTYWTFLIATLAIAGIPPLAGFFSKDAILAGVFEDSRYVLFGIGLLTAGLTAFYMFRLVSLTFEGRFRGTSEQEHHLHESPPSMTVPLVVLAFFSIIAGLIGLPKVFGE
ncbi:MAG TPA: NADH-quinone oxidoreductase subunit L, partial [Thermoanaerobaculia bacterium]